MKIWSNSEFDPSWPWALQPGGSPHKMQSLQRRVLAQRVGERLHALVQKRRRVARQLQFDEGWVILRQAPQDFSQP